MNAFKKGLLTAALLVAPAFAFAAGDHAAKGGPSSNVAWNVETSNFVENGDPQRGAGFTASHMCASCHGNDGISPSRNWPSIAGQTRNYTYKMLIDYRDGKRYNDIMTSITRTMSEQDLADVAAFYAALPAPAALDVSKPEDAMTHKLIVRGDGKRLLPACANCHGDNGEGGDMDTPLLSGQVPEYFVKTMQEYKTGSRHNDVYARMRLIAERLSDEEISNLANYYAAQSAN